MGFKFELDSCAFVIEALLHEIQWVDNHYDDNCCDE